MALYPKNPISISPVQVHSISVQICPRIWTRVRCWTRTKSLQCEVALPQVLLLLPFNDHFYRCPPSFIHSCTPDGRIIALFKPDLWRQYQQALPQVLIINPTPTILSEAGQIRTSCGNKDLIILQNVMQSTMTITFTAFYDNRITKWGIRISITFCMRTLLSPSAVMAACASPMKGPKRLQDR